MSIVVELWGGPLDGTTVAIEGLIPELRLPVLVRADDGQITQDEIRYALSGLVRAGHYVYRLEKRCPC